MKRILKLNILIIIMICLISILTPKVNAAGAKYVNEYGTITITGVEAGDQLQAYTIIRMEYVEETNELTHDFTSGFYEFLDTHEEYAALTIEDYYALTSGDITSGSTQTSSTLDKLISDFIAFLKEKNYLGEGGDLTISGTNATITAPVGAYVIVPVSTSRVYAPMVANIDYVANGTEWVTKDATVVAKVSDAKIKKYEYSLENNLNYPGFTIGRDYGNKIIITKPTYPTNATNKRYYITETFAEGITFNGLDTIKLIIGNDEYNATSEGQIQDQNGNLLGSATFENQILTIELYDEYISLNEITITYETKLNENAIIGPTGNTNNLVLNYSNDPYGTGMTSTEVYESIITTEGLLIYKYDQEDNTALEGAIFEIYADEELTDLVGTTTSGEDGIAKFEGLGFGHKYYIVETKAPSGYKLVEDIIVFDQLQERNLYPFEVPEGYYVLSVPNEKISFLPVTGGIGTVIYTLTGLIIVGGAFYYIKKQNKKQTNM